MKQSDIPAPWPTCHYCHEKLTVSEICLSKRIVTREPPRSKNVLPLTEPRLQWAHETCAREAGAKVDPAGFKIKGKVK